MAETDSHHFATLNEWSDLGTKYHKPQKEEQLDTIYFLLKESYHHLAKGIKPDPLSGWSYQFEGDKDRGT